jgi:bacteriorhodopsin
MLAGFVNLLWLLYPIAFAVSDGGNVISVTRSLIFFGILDLLLLCGTAFAFLFLARRWDYGRLHLNFTQYGRVGSYGNAVHHEKGHGGMHQPGGTATTAPDTYTGMS